MQQKKILVTGFAHSGTTILKELINRCTNASSCDFETYDFDAFDTDAQFKCVKYPFADESFFELDCIKLMIIRNPIFVFSSIQRRLQEKQTEKHTLNNWCRIAKYFIDENSFIKIKYEDMFADNNKLIRDLFDSIGLTYSDDIFEQRGVNKNISETDHYLYRMNQVNQSFCNMNTSEKITIDADMIKTIKSTSEYKSIYG